MNIHFVCRGNVLRSLIAESYLKSLQLKDVTVLSSGTNVNLHDAQEREYFANTIAVLSRHGVQSFAKSLPDQLTAQRIENQDVIVFMNQRVVDEAMKIVDMPEKVIDWGIVDIGEGHRTDRNSREQYEEEIYQEITSKVRVLADELGIGIPLD